MLKQILMTTAVVAIAAVSVQPASAKSRAIVVDELLVKKGQTGIPTPPSGVKPVGKPTANFIVAPNGGIPTPPPTGGAGKTGGTPPKASTTRKIFPETFTKGGKSGRKNGGTPRAFKGKRAQ